MKKRISTVAAALALAGSMMLVSTGTVGAATTIGGPPAGTGACAVLGPAAKGAGATAGAIRKFADCEIQRRMTTLTALSTAVNGLRTLNASHVAALASEIAGEKSGLATLKAKIDGEASLLGLEADLVRIVTEFRVYVLVVPQVNLTVAADVVVAAQSRLAAISTQLAARIAQAKAAGSDTMQAQADLDAMNAAVAAAVKLASPVPGQLVPLTAADYNSGTAGPAIVAARAALVGARDDLRNAAADARACLQALH